MVMLLALKQVLTLIVDQTETKNLFTTDKQHLML